MSEIRMRPLAVRPPFEGYILPVSGFPLRADETDMLNNFLHKFCSAAIRRWNLSTEVFLQLEQLIGDGAREAFADHGREWLPETGLGVWVDREPPQKWTLEEFKNLVPGDKLRPIMFQVFQISADQSSRIAARSLMLRYGSVLEILTHAGDSYLSKVKSTFKQGIVDRSYTSFPFYIGLLEGKTLASATLNQLQRWFEGITVYIRESAEDQGVLIASSVELGDIFASLGGARAANDIIFR